MIELKRQGCVLFVEGIPLNWTEIDLFNKFKIFGQVFATEIKKDETGVSKGKALVYFELK